jgi:hypothetical protein
MKIYLQSFLPMWSFVKSIPGHTTTGRRQSLRRESERVAHIRDQYYSNYHQRFLPISHSFYQFPAICTNFRRFVPTHFRQKMDNVLKNINVMIDFRHKN